MFFLSFLLFRLRRAGGVFADDLLRRDEQLSGGLLHRHGDEMVDHLLGIHKVAGDPGCPLRAVQIQEQGDDLTVQHFSELLMRNSIYSGKSIERPRVFVPNAQKSGFLSHQFRYNAENIILELFVILQHDGRCLAAGPGREGHRHMDGRPVTVVAKQSAACLVGIV